jgi:molybdopterin/thiamine biosynthesis adenylyltransferase
MYQEQDYVSRIREANARANKAAQRLYWDPEQKRIRPMSYCDPDRPGLEIEKPDLGHATRVGKDNTVITIFADTLKECPMDGGLDLQFYRRDNGQAFTQIRSEEKAGYSVPGILHVTKGEGVVDIPRTCAEEVRVCVVARQQQKSADPNTKGSCTVSEWETTGFVKEEKRWQEVSVKVIPLREHLFSRSAGLFDTDVISDTYVLGAGMGSVGSFLMELLTMSGIMRFILFDHDRVEAGNICRQNALISDIGRYKTKVAAERIHSKNPYAHVETHEFEITGQQKEFLRERIRRSDIVIGSVDKREPRIILNRLCVEEGKPLILMGAFHRAFGVQVLFMRRPGIDPCYVCYLMSLPPEAKNRHSSSLDQEELIAYADHPVPNPEPGLAVDIAPMIVMTARLCINHLLRNKPTTLQSLDEDLIAPWYMYLNRREGPYEGLKPLGFNVGDEMHILSWFGIELRRNPACPVCGNYVGEMSRAHGISISPKDVKKHERKRAEQQNV